MNSSSIRAGTRQYSQLGSQSRTNSSGTGKRVFLDFELRIKGRSPLHMQPVTDSADRSSTTCSTCIYLFYCIAQSAKFAMNTLNSFKAHKIYILQTQHTKKHYKSACTVTSPLVSLLEVEHLSLELLGEIHVSSLIHC